jgi:hypothetical protein
MKNIKNYEDKINEAKTQLPPMPKFLKDAGAQLGYSKYAKIWKTGEGPSYWFIEIPNTLGSGFYKGDSYEISFYPDKRWSLSVYVSSLGSKYLSNTGTWKETSGSSSQIMGKKINGVTLTIENLNSPKIQTFA